MVRLSSDEFLGVDKDFILRVFKYKPDQETYEQIAWEKIDCLLSMVNETTKDMLEVEKMT